MEERERALLRDRENLLQPWLYQSREDPVEHLAAD